MSWKTNSLPLDIGNSRRMEPQRRIEREKLLRNIRLDYRPGESLMDTDDLEDRAASGPHFPVMDSLHLDSRSSYPDARSSMYNNTHSVNHTPGQWSQLDRISNGHHIDGPTPDQYDMHGELLWGENRHGNWHPRSRSPRDILHLDSVSIHERGQGNMGGQNSEYRPQQWQPLDRSSSDGFHVGTPSQHFRVQRSNENAPRLLESMHVDSKDRSHMDKSRLSKSLPYNRSNKFWIPLDQSSSEGYVPLHREKSKIPVYRGNAYNYWLPIENRERLSFGHGTDYDQHHSDMQNPGQDYSRFRQIPFQKSSFTSHHRGTSKNKPQTFVNAWLLDSEQNQDDSERISENFSQTNLTTSTPKASPPGRSMDILVLSLSALDSDEENSTSKGKAGIRGSSYTTSRSSTGSSKGQSPEKYEVTGTLIKYSKLSQASSPVSKPMKRRKRQASETIDVHDTSNEPTPKLSKNIQTPKPSSQHLQVVGDKETFAEQNDSCCNMCELNCDPNKVICHICENILTGDSEKELDVTGELSSISSTRSGETPYQNEQCLQHNVKQLPSLMTYSYISASHTSVNDLVYIEEVNILDEQNFEYTTVTMPAIESDILVEEAIVYARPLQCISKVDENIFIFGETINVTENAPLGHLMPVAESCLYTECCTVSLNISAPLQSIAYCISTVVDDIQFHFCLCAQLFILSACPATLWHGKEDALIFEEVNNNFATKFYLLDRPIQWFVTESTNNYCITEEPPYCQLSKKCTAHLPMAFTPMQQQIIEHCVINNTKTECLKSTEVILEPQDTNLDAKDHYISYTSSGLSFEDLRNCDEASYSSKVSLEFEPDGYLPPGDEEGWMSILPCLVNIKEFYDTTVHVEDKQEETHSDEELQCEGEIMKIDKPGPIVENEIFEPYMYGEIEEEATGQQSLMEKNSMEWTDEAPFDTLIDEPALTKYTQPFKISYSTDNFERKFELRTESDSQFKVEKYNVVEGNECQKLVLVKHSIENEVVDEPDLHKEVEDEAEGQQVFMDTYKDSMELTEEAALDISTDEPERVKESLSLQEIASISLGAHPSSSKCSTFPFIKVTTKKTARLIRLSQRDIIKERLSNNKFSYSDETFEKKVEKRTVSEPQLIVEKYNIVKGNKGHRIVLVKHKSWHDVTSIKGPCPKAQLLITKAKETYIAEWLKGQFSKFDSSEFQTLPLETYTETEEEENLGLERYHAINDGDGDTISSDGSYLEPKTLTSLEDFQDENIGQGSLQEDDVCESDVQLEKRKVQDFQTVDDRNLGYGCSVESTILMQDECSSAQVEIHTNKEADNTEPEMQTKILTSEDEEAEATGAQCVTANKSTTNDKDNCTVQQHAFVAPQEISTNSETHASKTLQCHRFTVSNTVKAKETKAALEDQTKMVFPTEPGPNAAEQAIIGSEGVLEPCIQQDTDKHDEFQVLNVYTRYPSKSSHNASLIENQEELTAIGDKLPSEADDSTSSSSEEVVGSVESLQSKDEKTWVTPNISHSADNMCDGEINEHSEPDDNIGFKRMELLLKHRRLSMKWLSQGMTTKDLKDAYIDLWHSRNILQKSISDPELSKLEHNENCQTLSEANDTQNKQDLVLERVGDFNNLNTDKAAEVTEIISMNSSYHRHSLSSSEEIACPVCILENSDPVSRTDVWRIIDDIVGIYDSFTEKEQVQIAEPQEMILQKVDKDIHGSLAEINEVSTSEREGNETGSQTYENTDDISQCVAPLNSSTDELADIQTIEVLQSLHLAENYIYCTGMPILESTPPIVDLNIESITPTIVTNEFSVHTPVIVLSVFNVVNTNVRVPKDKSVTLPTKAPIAFMKTVKRYSSLPLLDLNAELTNGDQEHYTNITVIEQTAKTEPFSKAFKSNFLGTVENKMLQEKRSSVEISTLHSKDGVTTQHVEEVTQPGQTLHGPLFEQTEDVQFQTLVQDKFLEDMFGSDLLRSLKQRALVYEADNNMIQELQTYETSTDEDHAKKAHSSYHVIEIQTEVSRLKNLVKKLQDTYKHEIQSFKQRQGIPRYPVLVDPVIYNSVDPEPDTSKDTYEPLQDPNSNEDSNQTDGQENNKDESFTPFVKLTKQSEGNLLSLASQSGDTMPSAFQSLQTRCESVHDLNDDSDSEDFCTAKIVNTFNVQIMEAPGLVVQESSALSVKTNASQSDVLTGSTSTGGNKEVHFMKTPEIQITHTSSAPVEEHSTAVPEQANAVSPFVKAQSLGDDTESSGATEVPVSSQNVYTTKVPSEQTEGSKATGRVVFQLKMSDFLPESVLKKQFLKEDKVDEGVWDFKVPEDKTVVPVRDDGFSEFVRARSKFASTLIRERPTVTLNSENSKISQNQSVNITKQDEIKEETVSVHTASPDDSLQSIAPSETFKSVESDKSLDDYLETRNDLSTGESGCKEKSVTSQVGNESNASNAPSGSSKQSAFTVDSAWNFLDSTLQEKMDPSAKPRHRKNNEEPETTPKAWLPIRPFRRH